jgi:hypothetical protein
MAMPRRREIGGLRRIGSASPRRLARAAALALAVASLQRISTAAVLPASAEERGQPGFFEEEDEFTRTSTSCVVDPALGGTCSGTYQEDFEAHDHLDLAPVWETRARVAAPYFADATSVLDYGSGTGFLRTLLPAAAAYHAVDLRSHSDYAAEVCNANSGFVTRNATGLYDRVAVLGFLEYLCHPQAFLK